MGQHLVVRRGDSAAVTQLAVEELRQSVLHGDQGPPRPLFLVVQPPRLGHGMTLPTRVDTLTIAAYRLVNTLTTQIGAHNVGTACGWSSRGKARWQGCADH